MCFFQIIVSLIVFLSTDKWDLEEEIIIINLSTQKTKNEQCDQMEIDDDDDDIKESKNQEEPILIFNFGIKNTQILQKLTNRNIQDLV